MWTWCIDSEPEAWSPDWVVQTWSLNLEPGVHTWRPEVQTLGPGVWTWRPGVWTGDRKLGSKPRVWTLSLDRPGVQTWIPDLESGVWTRVWGIH